MRLIRKDEENSIMKSKEELEELKKEVEAVTEKCRELTPEELEQVTGGVELKRHIDIQFKFYNDPPAL